MGPLIILSGPSGCGKSTVIQRLLATSGLPLHLSVSATTRARRPDETDGVHYFFWTGERFEEARARGELLEWAKVYGNFYGTLRSEVEVNRRQGKGVLLDIDVQGAAQVRQRCPDIDVSIFMAPLSLEVLRQRLERRGTEDEPTIQRRLAAAEAEMARQGEYDKVVINDDLDRAVAEVKALVRQSFFGKDEG
ncbi:MAG: guanylate kinase [Planctomycetes bacterium]|nr:guanylate kinase [Planctomycetota bacterium]